MKKVLFVVCTHGDEQAGMELFYHYPYGGTEKIEWRVLVGNPEAMLLNLRIFEEDLNRVANSNSNSYEGKRGQILKRIMKEFDVVYDVHTTRGIQTEIQDCIFVNTLQSLPDAKFALAAQVIFDSTNNDQYVTSLHPNGITLEYTKTANVAQDRERVLRDFISIINQKESGSKQQLSEFCSLVTQKQARQYQFHWNNFKAISSGDIAKLKLKIGTYLPVFVNPPKIDRQIYAALNRVR